MPDPGSRFHCFIIDTDYMYIFTLSEEYQCAVVDVDFHYVSNFEITFCLLDIKDRVIRAASEYFYTFVTRLQTTERKINFADSDEGSLSHPPVLIHHFISKGVITYLTDRM